MTLVVGDEDELSDGDEELSDMLEDLGFEVDEVGEDEDSEDAEDSGLVVIAGSASASAIEDEYSDLDVPVMVMDNGLLPEMSMTEDGNNDSGQTSAEEVEIVLANHPIATGVTGRVGVVDNRAQLQWGTPPAGATVIARLADNANEAAIFVYDLGDQMAGGERAAERRVSFFSGDNAAEDLTADGQRLFENAALWAWSGGVSARPE